MLFISKIGDNSIDLPECNVLIQISSHFASRRQEAQRLGRILRPKSMAGGRYNAYFYTLVSKDTAEMKYAFKRQRFLVDQGYAFKVIKDMEAYVRNSKYTSKMTKEIEQDILQRIIDVGQDAGEEEQLNDFNEHGVSGDVTAVELASTKSAGPQIMQSGAPRSTSSMSAHSGGTAHYNVLRKPQPSKKRRRAQKYVIPQKKTATSKR